MNRANSNEAEWKYKLYNIVGAERHTQQEQKNKVPKRNLVLLRSKSKDLEQIFDELSFIIATYHKGES